VGAISGRANTGSMSEHAPRWREIGACGRELMDMQGSSAQEVTKLPACCEVIHSIFPTTPQSDCDFSVAGRPWYRSPSADPSHTLPTSLTGTCAPRPRSSRGVSFAGYQCQAVVAVAQQSRDPWCQGIVESASTGLPDPQATIDREGKNSPQGCHDRTSFSNPGFQLRVIRRDPREPTLSTLSEPGETVRHRNRCKSIDK